MTIESITLRDEATGCMVQAPEDAQWYDTIFYWTEGNFGCDCNRASYFDLPEEIECNSGPNRFVILKIVLSDGTVFDDFRELNPNNALSQDHAGRVTFRH